MPTFCRCENQLPFGIAAGKKSRCAHTATEPAMVDEWYRPSSVFNSLPRKSSDATLYWSLGAPAKNLHDRTQKEAFREYHCDGCHNCAYDYGMFLIQIVYQINQSGGVCRYVEKVQLTQNKHSMLYMRLYMAKHCTRLRFWYPQRAVDRDNGVLDFVQRKHHCPLRRLV